MATVLYEVRRFDRLQRIEHWAMVTSFTLLALTGVPQKFAGAGWAESMIALMGGIETVRIIHRLAAIVLILSSISHVIELSYRIFVKRTALTMLPRPKDVVDFLDAIRFNLGLSNGRPRYDRFNFEEKLEYWALIWGTLVMIATGFVLWNPIATTRFLAGEFIPAAKAAHGGEALLAVLSVLTWHLYSVHIRTLNRSMFTGKMSRAEMLHEHPIELVRLEGRPARPAPSAEVIRRRQRVFLPFAAVATVVLLVVLWQFVTFEHTAIATVPRHELAQVFVPFTPTPPPTATLAPARATATAIAIAIPQPTVVAGMPSFQGVILPALQTNCSRCHGNIAGLTVTDYESLMRGGSSGSPVTPGKPDSSLIIRKLNGAHAGQLSAEQLALLKAWIAAGAPDN